MKKETGTYKASTSRKFVKVDNFTAPFINTNKSSEEWKGIAIDLILKINQIQNKVNESTTISNDDKELTVLYASEATDRLKSVICCDIIDFSKLGDMSSIVGRMSSTLFEDTCLAAKDFVDKVISFDDFHEVGKELMSWSSHQLAR